MDYDYQDRSAFESQVLERLDEIIGLLQTLVEIEKHDHGLVVNIAD